MHRIRTIASIRAHMPQLVRADATHNRWGWLFGNGQVGPFSARGLLLPPSHHDAVLNRTWNAGRHAPGVALTLSYDGPVTLLKLCPCMKPVEGIVGLVLVLDHGERIAHHALWRESEWVTISLPTPARELRIEFMESPSWIALHAVDAILATVESA